ncbi:MAG: hypothetical protein CSA54_05900, partial [Gammaproteobacteria bacterium]
MCLRLKNSARGRNIRPATAADGTRERVSDQNNPRPTPPASNNDAATRLPRRHRDRFLATPELAKGFSASPMKANSNQAASSRT